MSEQAGPGNGPDSQHGTHSGNPESQRAQPPRVADPRNPGTPLNTPGPQGNQTPPNRQAPPNQQIPPAQMPPAQMPPNRQPTAGQRPPQQPPVPQGQPPRQGPPPQHGQPQPVRSNNDRFRPNPAPQPQQPGPGSQHGPGFQPQPQQPQPQRPQPQQQRQIPQPGMNPQMRNQGNPNLGGPMGQPQGYSQPPMQGQPQGYSQPPMQPRVYEQPRFAPTVTQEMRVRATMQAPQQMVSETPWTGAVRQSQPAEEPGSTGNVVRMVLGIIAVVGLTVGLLILALVGGLSFGLKIFGLVGLSAIPLIGIVAYVLWLDRWKPQPKLILGLCLLWGAVAAVVLTLFVTLIGQVAIYLAGFGGVPDVVGTVIQAPIIEETTKTSLLVVLVLAARRYFEGPLDGLVYGALIGAGFAFTENVLYLGNAWNEEAVGGLLLTFVMRCLCSPLLHTVFSTCAGVTIGFAARKWPWWAVVLMWLPGLLLGMLLHAIWNGTMTGLGELGFIAQIIGLIVLSFILTSCWVVLGLILRRSERLHTLNMLGDYANSGWLSHSEVDMLGTWKGRKHGKRWADSFPGGKEEMRTMIRTSGKLSTTRMRLLAGLGGTEERKIEEFQLKDFSSARDRLLAASRRVAR